MSDALIVTLVLVAFGSGGLWAAGVAWFVWIYHERRTLRIQAQMFDEAAKWARATTPAKDGGMSVPADGWAVFGANWEELWH